MVNVPVRLYSAVILATNRIPRPLIQQQSMLGLVGSGTKTVILPDVAMYMLSCVQKTTRM